MLQFICFFEIFLIFSFVFPIGYTGLFILSETENWNMFQKLSGIKKNNRKMLIQNGFSKKIAGHITLNQKT